ncbi:MAG: Rdx family protein [Armatimonadetes bacterium]|nr:Rdx family protein [Armatimonadota bacterium]
MPHAARLAAAFQSEFGLETEYIPGSGGILEIRYQGEIVWTNNDRRGVKPSNEEAIAAMRPFVSG